MWNDLSRWFNHLLSVVKRAIEDPDFAIAERLNTMDRDQVYEESVRMYTKLLEKCEKYGYKPDTQEFNNFQRFDCNKYFKVALPLFKCWK